MDKILIPARRGSKGWANKNRKLLRYTLEALDEESRAKTTILTNDAVIEHQAHLYGVKSAYRADTSERDTSSVLEAIKPHCKDMDKDTVITMLYLTYPYRTMKDIRRVWEYWNDRQPESLLCRKRPKTHPYLCITNVDLMDRGDQLITHGLYRRQDYPEVWEITHFVSMFRVSEIRKLNGNCYNSETAFFLLDEKYMTNDIDSEDDL